MSVPSRPRATGIELLWVPPDELHPNAWNPNVLDADLYDKAVASIQTYGFVDPITVRVIDDHYEVIDGEHRVKAARQLGLRLVPVVIVDVDDDVAQQLTLVLNELHGHPDQSKLTRVLQGLAERHSIESLLETLPFTREQFMASIPHPTDLSVGPIPTEVTRWVERMYRLPRSAADTLDAALIRAREYEEVTEDWQALEAIAQAYLDH